ncbi:hypothetical protein [Spartinivicinus ruber]|uniref:hypothetical protein n=1 Tax=Spartinivicinus ruber TaxID=2683272 RepID=UPI0013D2299C|nr:hypothetical protein [Spartinivicinus ruber]
MNNSVKRNLSSLLGKKKIIVAFIYVLIVLAVIYSLNILTEDSNKNKNISNSIPEFLTTTMGNTVMTIPTKYMKGKHKTVGKNYRGEVASVKLWALLPNFDWYDPTRNQYEFIKELGGEKRIHISLSLRNGVRPVHKFLDKDGGQYYQYSYFVNSEYSENKYGIEIYKQHDKRNNWYLYKDKKGNLQYKMTCYKERTVPSPSCSGLWEYSDDVRVRIDFKKKYLPIWHQIYTQVNNLIKSEQRTAIYLPISLNGK